MKNLNKYFFLIVVFAALWPVWKYLYIFSFQKTRPELFLFVFAIGFFLYEQFKYKYKVREFDKTFFSLTLFFLWSYIFFYGQVPALGRALLAMLTLSSTLLMYYPKSEAISRLSYFVLLPFSLPFEASLQFVIGYPLRKITAEISAFLLSPYNVLVKGTTLFYSGNPLEVDVACSGIQGFSTLIIVAGIIGLTTKMRVTHFSLLMILAFASTLVYNILRTSLLFVNHFQVNIQNDFSHSAIGSLAFIIILIAFLFISKKLIAVKPI